MIDYSAGGGEANLGCSVREKAVEELNRGREFADQLKLLMGKPDGSISIPSKQADDLLRKLLLSFTNTLSLLRTPDFDDELPVDSPPPHSRRSDDSGDSIRSSLTTKNRRGCYKRRKSENSWSREDSPRPFEDGHSWRKYGQKNILRAKHPRNYFRCTHKYDQNCQATKQVQKVRDDPPVVRTTYYGHHTCRDLLNPQHLILDSAISGGRSSVYLSFDRAAGERDDQNDSFTLTTTHPVKRETGGDEIEGSSDLVLGNDRHDDQNLSTVLNSCTASSGDQSLGMVHDSFDFDIDALSFDFLY